MLFLQAIIINGLPVLYNLIEIVIIFHLCFFDANSAHLSPFLSSNDQFI